MIVVRHRGGLGNQLFQYAAGLALARHHQTELKVDLYTYSKHRYRKFELDHFMVEPKVASRKEVHRYTGNNPVVRYLNKRENYLRCPMVFAQPHYHFFEDFFELPSDLYLSGYWQSEKYFAPVQDELRTLYQPRLPLDSTNAAMKEKIQNVNSVSIHVRRGDYTTGSYNRFFGGIPDDYYINAVSEIKKYIGDPVFFIFSDSVEWCKRNLVISPAVFVDMNQGDASFKDLFLMSWCKHNIIANSTFSWWGAWLNNNPQKKVIAPRPWFRQRYIKTKEPAYASRYYNTKDLLPLGWIEIG
jgi:Glycosyl transferase family 11